MSTHPDDSVDTCLDCIDASLVSMAGDGEKVVFLNLYIAGLNVSTSGSRRPLIHATETHFRLAPFWQGTMPSMPMCRRASRRASRMPRASSTILGSPSSWSPSVVAARVSSWRGTKRSASDGALPRAQHPLRRSCEGGERAPQGGALPHPETVRANYYEENRAARFNLLMPSSLAEYAHARAAAINAVPVPEAAEKAG
jgi:hypothetical protein